MRKPDRPSLHFTFSFEILIRTCHIWFYLFRLYTYMYGLLWLIIVGVPQILFRSITRALICRHVKLIYLQSERSPKFLAPLSKRETALSGNYYKLTPFSADVSTCSVDARGVAWPKSNARQTGNDLIAMSLISV